MSTPAPNPNTEPAIGDTARMVAVTDAVARDTRTSRPSAHPAGSAAAAQRCDARIDVTDETERCERPAVYRIEGRHAMCAEHACFLQEMAGAHVEPLRRSLADGWRWVVDVAGLAYFVVAAWSDLSRTNGAEART